jgi:hypothetical protein
MASTDSEAAIRALVERHQVCWDTFAEWSQTNGERKQTGVVVELYGTHDAPGVVPKVGCKHCIPVIQALLAIADHVTETTRDELSSIRAHSGIEYAVERGARPDIVVALTLAGAPEARAAAVTQVRARLLTIGAAERTWRAHSER